MAGVDWQQVRSLFHRAVDLEPSAQADFLTAAKEPTAVREEVRSLLAAEEAEPFALVRLVDQWTEGPERDALRPGDRVGPYQLLRELGRGGMSTVFLAAREDEHFQQQVALKVLRPELPLPEMAGRFHRERQILASFEHPNIARLLDGGTAPNGAPYLVMEAVEGLPIDQHCRLHNLPLKDRLELFRSVCASVHHAHQNLVVHRDLKPSNVLVTRDGVPKLLDFGIAKLLNPELSRDALVATLPSLRPMSLGYASPEQARGEPLTTATDVYSLGALLYELLTGERPLAFEGLTKEEAVAALGSRRPAPPSSRPVCVRGVDRDLDAVVLKALTKEPRERYASALDLAGDLERWQRHLPVVARRGTALSRAGKALRRNPVAALLSAAVFAFAAAMTIQSSFLLRALAESKAARDRAEHAADSVIALLEQADPLLGDGDAAAAASLLAAGRQRLSRELEGDPLLAARLLDTLGRAELNRGDAANAAADFERSLALRRQVYGDRHEEVAASLTLLASARLLTYDAAAARRLNEEALALRREIFGEEHAALAESLHQLAEVEQYEGHFAAAEPLFERAFDLRQRLAPGDRKGLADSVCDLGYLRFDQGRLEESQALLLRGVVLWRELGKAGQRELANCLGSLGSVAAARGELAEAELALREAFIIRQRVFGPRHPDLARAQLDLGELLHHRGSLVAADELLTRALALYRELGDDHRPMLGTAASLLALLRQQQGRLAEAEALAAETLAIYRAEVAPNHPFLAQVLVNLARIERQRGQRERAEGHLQEAVALRRRHAPPNSQELGFPLFELGRVLNELGRFGEARPLLEEAAAVLGQTLVVQDAHLTKVRSELAKSRARSPASASRHLDPHSFDALEVQAVGDREVGQDGVGARVHGRGEGRDDV